MPQSHGLIFAAAACISARLLAFLPFPASMHQIRYLEIALAKMRYHMFVRGIHMWVGFLGLDLRSRLSIH